MQPVAGARVGVPSGRQHAIGIVTGCSDTSELPLDKLKPIDSVIDAESLFSLACGASCAGPAITITTPLAKCCSMRCRSCCGKANRPRPRRCGNGSPPKRARHPARKPETRAETAAGAGGAVATPGLSPRVSQLELTESALQALRAKGLIDLRAQVAATHDWRPNFAVLGERLRLNTEQATAVGAIRSEDEQFAARCWPG